jgi:hypothetical protein
MARCRRGRGRWRGDRLVEQREVPAGGDIEMFEVLRDRPCLRRRLPVELRVRQRPCQRVSGGRQLLELTTKIVEFWREREWVRSRHCGIIRGMRTPAIVLCIALASVSARAEVTKVTIAARTPVANGQTYGSTGAYEKLTGTIEFALDPRDRHNARIVDLQYAQRGPDGRVRFSTELYVLRPVDAAKGNGVLLFEVANRGRKGTLGRFNRARGSDDPTTAADLGDGFLMREGYTLVWIGWETDVPAPAMRMDAPLVQLPDSARDRLTVPLHVNRRSPETFLVDEPGGRPPVRYPPVDPNDPASTLTVRDRQWDRATTIARDKWRFLTDANGLPKVALDGGFEPGRMYELTYRPSGARAAGVAHAAFRDAASAFRFRTDLPVQGRTAYVFGASQSGRFLREFLYQGFNVDERDRRAFDAVWPHISGTGIGPFNERFAMTTLGGGFGANRFPFTDLPQRDKNGKTDGLLSVYGAAQQPKVFYTNTSVEYWGQGRAAALTHTTIDGRQDATVPDNVRIYLLAGTQHGEAAFPPTASNGQQQNNPTPQGNVMRALLRGLDQWVRAGKQPPASQHPRVADRTLVAVSALKFPAIPTLRDPRTIEAPRRVTENGFGEPMPFLVSQVDEDGNEIAGIRVPEQSVPLATTTGWNFRAESVGNPTVIYPLLGSYMPLARTRAERDAKGDPRRSIEERYAGKDDYLRRIDAAAAALVKGGYLLDEDLPNVRERAASHWDFAQKAVPVTTAAR